MKYVKGAKGANAIIIMGILAIFIAMFFILFAFERLVLTNIACLIYTAGSCIGETFAGLTLGLFIIFLLLVMIAIAIYIMFISFDVRRRYKYNKYGKGSVEGELSRELNV